MSNPLSHTDDYYLGVNGTDTICSKLGSMVLETSQPMPCDYGFYQCFTPVYCNVGAIKNGDSCMFAQEFSYTNYSISNEEYCKSLGYDLPSVNTIESYVLPELFKNLVII